MSIFEKMGKVIKIYSMRYEDGQGWGGKNG